MNEKSFFDKYFILSIILFELFERLSIMTISKLASSNFIVVWEPINPVPPVTRIFFKLLKNFKIHNNIIYKDKFFLIFHNN